MTPERPLLMRIEARQEVLESLTRHIVAIENAN